MSVVVDLPIFRRNGKTLDQQISDRVASQIDQCVSRVITYQAKARAIRNVSAGVGIDESIRRAVAWAVNANKYLPPAA